jgi:hypothetical protein
MHASPDEAADGGAEEQQEQQSASEMIAHMGDGEEPEGQNSRFERGG